MDLVKFLRVIPDFPEPGVSFKDITPILQNPEAFVCAVDLLWEKCRDRKFDVIVCPEARGFIFAAPLAYKMGVAFVPVRKHGKLPYETIGSDYALEYGTDSLEIHKDAIKPGQRVLILDDVLATGGTILAVIDLVKQLGGVIDSAAFLIELEHMDGRKSLEGCPVFSVITLDS